MACRSKISALSAASARIQFAPPPCARRPSAYVGPMVSPTPPLPQAFSQLSLTEAAERLAARQLPPVDQWHPTRSGDSAMEIRADGHWYHEGGRIDRPAMVRLFSTILRREPAGGHVLVNQAQKLAIAVSDPPFPSVLLKSEGARRARRLLFPLYLYPLVLFWPFFLSVFFL